MDAATADRVWCLYRSYRSGTAPYVRIAAAVLHARLPDIVPIFRSSDTGSDGHVTGCEGHGGRSVWIYAPWADGGRAFPGYEYKGAGNFDGTPPYLHVVGPYQVIVGGHRLEWAVEEFDTTRRLEDAGVDVQRPLALFELFEPAVDARAALLVRATQSAVRVMHFCSIPHLLPAYLQITGESRDAYAERLGAALGRSTRLMLDIGVAAPLNIDNVSSEGELVDLEHVWNGWYYGHPVPRSYLVETIYPLFRDIHFVLSESAGRFEDQFAAAFCGAKVEGSPNPRERTVSIVEQFVGEPVNPAELLAPVAIGVREKLLADWTQALEFYRRVDENRGAFVDVPGTAFLLHHVDELVAMTETDIDLLKRRPLNPNP